jgi:hypothetical protein
MSRKKISFVLALVLLVSASICSAAIVPIDGVDAGDPNIRPYNLKSVTVGGETLSIDQLMTGKTSWITSDPGDPNIPVLVPDANMDDLDINTMLQWSGRPGNFQIIFDVLWTNHNGDAIDFILFEVGGNSGDDPTFAAIFEDGSLGAELHIEPGVNLVPGWGPTGYIRNAADANDGVTTDNQEIHGLAFAISDLFDVNGVNLTNDAVIKGIKLVDRGGTDPSGFFAVFPEPINVATVAELEAAAAAASYGDRIILTEGTYVLSSQIVLQSGVTYKGAGEGLTIIDGNNATRAFAAWGDRSASGQVDANGVEIPNLTGPRDLVIEDLTIQNAVSDAEDNGLDLSDDGGALCMLNGAKGTIRNCTISNCTSVDDGGAIYAELAKDNAVAGEPSISLDGVTIDGCTALDDGGGLYLDSDADYDGDPGDLPAPHVVIDNSVLRNCRAGGPAPDDGDRDGGGMYLDDSMGSFTMTNTILDNCTAGRHGAGIQMQDEAGNCLIDSCQILNCSNDPIDGEGGDGVAVSFTRDSNYDVTITNCIFANNVNNQDDAVLKIDSGLLLVANCTFVGNQSLKDKAILRFGRGGAEDPSFINKAINNLFVNNDTSGAGDPIIGWNRDGNTNITNNNCFFGNVVAEGVDLIKNTDAAVMVLSGDFVATADPLVDAVGGDYHLAAGSEAIDAGIAEGAPDHDIEGNARPQGAAHDIGAYEAVVN